jgi:hypothetical protein
MTITIDHGVQINQAVMKISTSQARAVEEQVSQRITVALPQRREQCIDRGVCSGIALE